MTDFDTRIARLLSELGVAADFIEHCALPLQVETEDLMRAEDDMFGREQYMSPLTEQKWREMKQAALEDGIELLLVSAFRSVEYLRA